MEIYLGKNFGDTKEKFLSSSKTRINKILNKLNKEEYLDLFGLWGKKVFKVYLCYTNGYKASSIDLFFNEESTDSLRFYIRPSLTDSAFVGYFNGHYQDSAWISWYFDMSFTFKKKNTDTTVNNDVEFTDTAEQIAKRKLKKAQAQEKAFGEWLNSSGTLAKLELQQSIDKGFKYKLQYGINDNNEFYYTLKTWEVDIETGQKVEDSDKDLNPYSIPDISDNSSEVNGTVKVEWGTPPKLEINPNPQLKLGVDTTELSNAKIPISNPDLLQLPVKFVEDPKIGFDTTELDNKKLIVDASDLENRKLGIDLTEKLKLDWSDVKSVPISIPEGTRLGIDEITGKVKLDANGQYVSLKTDGQSLAVRVDKDQKLDINIPEDSKIDLGVPEVINHSIKMVDLDKLVTSLDNLNDTEFRNALKTMALQISDNEYGEYGIRKEEHKVAQNRNNVDYNNEVIIYNRSDGEKISLKKGYKHNQMKKTEREIEQQYQQFSLNEVDIYAADNTKIGRNKVDVTDHLSGLGIKKPESREELKDYDIMLDVYEKYSDTADSETEVDIDLQGKKS